MWRDKAYQTRLKALCEGLSELDAWVRMHYVYPYPHVDEVVPLMAENRILRPGYPVPARQPAHPAPDETPGAVEKTLERVQNWRRIAPDITVRSTFIVGFPGETEAEFEELLSFLDEAQLDRVGAFAYSPVEGATANDLPDAVPEEVKQERLARFMGKQAQISAARLEAKIGTVQQCLVDAIEGDIAVAAPGPMRRRSTAWCISERRSGAAAGGRFRRRGNHRKRRARPVRRCAAGQCPPGVRPQGTVIATAAAGDGSGVRRSCRRRVRRSIREVFAHPLFAGLQDFRDLLLGPRWPSIAALDAPAIAREAPG